MSRRSFWSESRYGRSNYRSALCIWPPTDNLFWCFTSELLPQNAHRQKKMHFFTRNIMTTFPATQTLTKANTTFYSRSYLNIGKSCLWSCKGTRPKRDKENIVAIIGDGLRAAVKPWRPWFCRRTQLNLIIVVNDNDMSIAENHGGIYKGLRLFAWIRRKIRPQPFQGWVLTKFS